MKKLETIHLKTIISTRPYIPDTHIEISDSVEDPRTKTYTMMLRNREGTSINDDVDPEFNTNSQQIQYFWDFGCGHTEKFFQQLNIKYHTYDDGSLHTKLYNIDT